MKTEGTLKIEEFIDKLCDNKFSVDYLDRDEEGSDNISMCELVYEYNDKSQLSIGIDAGWENLTYDFDRFELSIAYYEYVGPHNGNVGDEKQFHLKNMLEFNSCEEVLEFLEIQ